MIQHSTKKNHSKRKVPTYRPKKNNHRLPKKKQSKWRLPIEQHTIQVNSQINQIFDSILKISSKDETITVQVSLKCLLLRMMNVLRDVFGMKASSNGIRLVGSTASNIVNGGGFVVNDIDISIYLAPQNVDFNYVLMCEEMVLMDIIAEQYGILLNYRDIFSMMFRDCFMVKSLQEYWSIISIGTADLAIDIKFIHTSHRHFAFSTDSFEVVIDDYITSVEKPENLTVISSYGNYIEALFHLKNNRIKTIEPWLIYKGYFRYTLELAKGRTPLKVDKSYYEDIFRTSFWVDFEKMSTAETENIIYKFCMRHRAHFGSILDHLFDLLFPSKHPKKDEILTVLSNLQE
eukprot:TRINITY_DN10357_c0_g1_i1.p1 TRINITY_DN10357_c0_g1~~TRINITY_DN10357_c0_g1_i1.p1  ORF type:complete len:346 (-),score=44.10 TRINITY_DN10357_c0_g1_i1:33-1070(-)